MAFADNRDERRQPVILECEDMNVETIDIDGNTLSTRKVVEVGSKEIETPAKALQVGKLRASENVSSQARGVAEIYRKATAAALENSRSGWTGLAERLKVQAKRAHEDEIIVPFVEYDDTADLDVENARECAVLQANYGDLIVVPLMVPLVRAADDGDGLNAPEVSAILKNTETFIEAVQGLDIEKPVMGVFPSISEECTRALFDIYAEAGVRAYCVDFTRRSPMAQAQLDNVINPLMGLLSDYGLRENSFVYAVNANDSRSTESNRRTPDSMYSYTIGFDIFGDNHISPNWPEEVFEEIARQNAEEEVELRLFDADTISVVDVPVSNLNSFLPSEAQIDVSRVQNRIAQNPDEKYRYANLINAELISLYLRSQGGIDAREIFDELSGGSYAQEQDIERVQELVDDIRGD